MICPNYGRQNGYGTNLLKCEPDSVILVDKLSFILVASLTSLFHGET
jgi:hypothetical protein